MTFQEKILSFYFEHKRDLPWRKTTDAYKIWISEVMLQQTQVDRVIEYFERWVKRWPTVHDLARASKTDVLSMWMGLGYNSRAVNMHNAAKIISEQFNGDVLLAIKTTKLPGIGPYTSSAIRIFCANEDIVTVDTNIRRILMHEFKLENPTDKELYALAQQCLPCGKSRDWHNALMDYGATLLTSRASGIAPKTRQSTFEGSDRQIRARIVRFVLAQKTTTLDEIQRHIADERCSKILQALVDDGMLVRSGNTFRIAD